MNIKRRRELRIVIASVADRDELVAEIWTVDNMLAEIRRVDGELRVELYPDPAGRAWDVSLDDLFYALETAKLRLTTLIEKQTAEDGR
jgi:hypothetical protein